MDSAYDLIVVGTGAAGMTAAIVAHAQGLRVILLEKTAQIGGTTAVSGGACWVPNSHYMAGLEAKDSVELAMTYLDNTTGTPAGRDHREVYLRRAPEAVRYLETVSELVMPARPFTPDYVSDVEGAQNYGRVLVTKNFDGSVLGERFNDLRPPYPETCFGTAMLDGPDLAHLLNARRSLRSAWHTVKLVANHVVDRLKHHRYRRGSRLTLGNAMVARLYKTVLDRGIPVVRGAAVSDLWVEAGTVVGVVLRSPEKAMLRGRHGVVLATGGFPAGDALRRSFIAQVPPGYTAAPRDNTGDGIAIALAHNARFDARNLNGAFWCPVSVGKRRDGSAVHFPHLIADRPKPGLIAVNRHGRRFTNEAEPYHKFVQAMLAGDQMPVHLVCDHRFVRRYPFGIVRPVAWSRRKHRRDGYLIAAGTIEELAQRIAVDPRALRATLERYNADARAGVDRELGKGSTLYQRNLGDSSNTPHPSLAPIERPPFYAIRVHPGDIGTAHGLATDANGCVLDTEGRVIDGLYACGNDKSSIMGGAYPAGGITLGPAITFAYLAALHAAAKALASRGETAPGRPDRAAPASTTA